MNRILLVIDRGLYGSRAKDLGEHFQEELNARGVHAATLVAEGLELDPSFERETKAFGADALLRLALNGGSNYERIYDAVLVDVGTRSVLWGAQLRGSEHEIGPSSEAALAKAAVERLITDGFVQGREVIN